MTRPAVAEGLTVNASGAPAPCTWITSAPSPPFMVSSSSPPRQISRSSPASPSKTSRVSAGLSSPMIWSSPAPPCISSTRSLPKIWSLPAPASIVVWVSAG